MRLFDELERRLRGMVLRMKPVSIDDDGAVQTASGIVMHDDHRSDVEVMQPYGFSSVAPQGSMMLVLAVGGDPGDLVGLPIGSPAMRAGGLAPGESVQYGPAGQRIHCKADGTIDVRSGVKVTLKAPSFEFQAGDCTVLIDENGVSITGGGLSITGGGMTASGGEGIALSGGTLTHNGRNVGETHTHTGVQPGGGTTGTPS